MSNYLWSLNKGDPFVTAAEDALHTVAVAAIPGTFLVDSLPFLRFVPAWFPGAGFQRKASEWKVLARRMVDMPYEAAIRLIVSCVIVTTFA